MLLKIGREASVDTSCSDLLAEEGLEGLTVLRELTDTLVELVRRHLVVAKRPAELGLVVNVRDLRKRVGGGSC